MAARLLAAGDAAGVTGGALREAAVAAGVTALLALPLVGLHAVQVGGELIIETRFAEVAVAVALVFLGRFALVAVAGGVIALPLVLGLLVAAGAWLLAPDSEFLRVVAVAGGLVVAARGALALVPRRRAEPGGEAAMDRVARGVQAAAPYVAPGIILFALALPFLPFADRRLLDLAILVMTYVMLGWGLNVVVGLAGLLDLGYVAFYAVGAYSYALIAQDLGFGFWACLPLAGLFAACFGVMLGFPVLRLRGDYLAIVTLGFGEMIRIILLNWVSFTNGPDGISGIPRPSFFGLAMTRFAADGGQTFHEFFDIAYSPLYRIIFLYYLILFMALLTNAFTLRIRRLPIGRAWEALREDEIACRSLGINPTNTKLTAFAIGAMFAGFAGSFFATRQGFISPESFTFIESAIIVAIVVLGGMGSQIGVALAALLLIGLPEWFRDLQEYRMLAFGAGMVLIMTWRPRGLLAFRAPTIRLAGQRP